MVVELIRAQEKNANRVNFMVLFWEFAKIPCFFSVLLLGCVLSTQGSDLVDAGSCFSSDLSGECDCTDSFQLLFDSFRCATKYK